MREGQETLAVSASSLTRVMLTALSVTDPVSPEINPCTYGQLINDRGAKNTQWGRERIVSSIDGIEKTEQPHARE